MNRLIKNVCFISPSNKSLMLLLTTFLVTISFTFYSKSHKAQHYETLYTLKSMKLINQKIETYFSQRHNTQSFDNIVKLSKAFHTLIQQANKQELYTDDTFRIFLSDIIKRFEKSQALLEHHKSGSSLISNSMRLLVDRYNYLSDTVEKSQLSNRQKLVKELESMEQITALIPYDGISNIPRLKASMDYLLKESAQINILNAYLMQTAQHLEIIASNYTLLEKLEKQNSALMIESKITKLYTDIFQALRQHDAIENRVFFFISLITLLLFILLFRNYQNIKHLNQDLCQLNEDMKLIIEKFDNNVIASRTDAKGIITYASEQFCKISGYRQEELIGSNHSIIRHPDMKTKIFTELWSTITAGREWKGEIKNRRKDGGFYWVETIITPEYDKDGKISGYSAIRHNITDQKKLEEMKESLEEQVDQRTLELQEMVKKVELLSVTDELTQLYNRRHYTKVFEDEINRLKRQDYILNYLLLDIDNFKLYNDNYGHLKGDEALKAIANALLSSIKRTSDFAFRMGGEEFLILFITDNVDQALQLSNQIRENILDLKIEHNHNTPYNSITISAGLVCMQSSSTIVDENSIYHHADELLYKAKNGGRNRIESELLS